MTPLVASRRRLIAAVLGLTCLATFACSPRETARESPAILLFAGIGTSPNDVVAFETLLDEQDLRFDAVDSRRLDSMSEAELRTYRLMLVPGGNFEEIGNGLAPETTARIRNAVRGGMNYLGVCAGAFFAGDSPYNGLDLTGGVRFGFYALERDNVRKAAVEISVAGSGSFDHYWEDGPELTGWGDVVAKYPDGTPALVEGSVGAGWVILAGVHAEAPASWRRDLSFSTPVEVDRAYAAELVAAALEGTRLEHF